MNKMTDKVFRTLLSAFSLLVLAACSSSDDTPDPDPTPGGEESVSYSVTKSKILEIDPKVSVSDNATYDWSVSGAPSELYSLQNRTSQKPLFVAAVSGDYKLKLLISDKGEVSEKDVVVTVNNESKAYKYYINKVYDFKPAPGQFVNDLPPANSGDSYETILRRTNDYLAKEQGTLISLGGFGGYVVFGFDHTIANVKGKRDFRVLGNAFWAENNPNPEAPTRGGSSEAGVIMVSYDKNGNGLPDDEWYEIKGAAHDMEGTVFNYELTYHKPDPNKVPVPGGGTGTVMFTDVEYIKWEDNQGRTDYMWQNNAYNHSLDYWPKWLDKEQTMTFKGTRLPDNAIDESGTGSYYVQYAFAYGYADNAPNTDDESAIDIDWAIDSKGNKVNLPGIDFVKVYNGLNQQCGWLGETSTEIMGATDLHLKGESIATRVN